MKISLALAAIAYLASASTGAGFLASSDVAGSVAGATVESAPFTWPISDAPSRITKKPFGLHITPATSPVPNDHFTGYHVGTDFETTVAEQDLDVPIYAVCDGPVTYKAYVNGYGGVFVQACQLDNKTVSVLYGHLRLSSITSDIDDELKQGQQLGVLGTGYSSETDGVRKHLHLGINTDEELDVHGYVQDSAKIDHWLDAMLYLPD